MRKILSLLLIVSCLVLLGGGCSKKEKKIPVKQINPPVTENQKDVGDTTKQQPVTTPAVKQKIIPQPPVQVVPQKKCDITKDVKNQYCGIKVTVYACKCAFHGEYCDKANMDKQQAYNYVMNGFNSWVASLNKACEAGQ